MIYLTVAALCSLPLFFLGMYFAILYKRTKKELDSLKTKFKSNPSYETQLFMADMLRGDVLFHIERVPPESVFIRRD